MAKEAELKSDYDDIFEISRSGWENQLQQGALDLDFYFRAQHTVKEAAQAEEQDRTLFTLDKIGRQVDLLHGFEIKNRHILKIGQQGALSQEEDQACSQHTGVLMNLMVMAGGYDVISDAFKWGTLIQGSNLIEIWRDRNRDLQFSRLGWNQFKLNPGLSKTDLSDCGDILIGRWVDKKRLKGILPADPVVNIDKIPTLTNISRWNFLRDPVLQNRAERMLVEEWWRRDTESVDMVISRVNIPATPTVSAFNIGDEKLLTEFADDYFGGDVKLAKFRIQEMKRQDGLPFFSRRKSDIDKIKLTIFVNERLVFDGLNPLKLRDYNFIWVHGDWCPECPRDDIKLQSHVRRLRDPQRALNRRTNQIYDIIESQAHGVRVMRSNRIRNWEDGYKSGQGVVLHADENWPDELPLDQLFRQMPASDVPAGLFAALEMTDKAETEVGGLNNEIFGTDDKDIPAILAKHRTGAALTGFGGMFQGFRDAKKQLGRKLVRLVQLNYSPQKVSSLINQQPVPGFYEKNLTRYDCTPVEGLLTDSQQELFYLHLLSLRQMFPKEAHKLPLSEVAKYSSTPFRPELIQMIQKAEQKEAQAMQKGQQLQERQAMIEMELAKGNILANRGIAAAQRAKAVEDQSDAALNRVKTIAEIKDIGAARVLELASLGLQFEQLSQQNREISQKS